MRLHWDLDLGYLVRTPGTDTKLSKLEFKRGDATILELLCYRSGVAVLLGSEFDLRFALKEKGRYDAGPVVYTASFSENSSAKTYTARPSLNTTELNALLLVDDQTSNDRDSIDLIGEFSYRIGSASSEWQSTQTLKVTIFNDVIRGDESTPAAAQQPENYLTMDRLIEYLPLVVGLTGGGGSKLDGLASTEFDLGKLVALVDDSQNPAVLRTYELVAGTNAESSPDIVRPDDYEATENARVWRLRTPSVSNAVRYDASQSLNGAQQFTARSNINAAARAHRHPFWMEAMVFSPSSPVYGGSFDLFMIPDPYPVNAELKVRIGEPAYGDMMFQFLFKGPSNGWAEWAPIGFVYIGQGGDASDATSASLYPGDMLRLETFQDGSGYAGGPVHGLYAMASLITGYDQ